jgi:hypothetical protein
MARRGPEDPATLAVFAQVREHDAAFAETILRFWSGGPIAVPELRRRLRETGEQRHDRGEWRRSADSVADR